MTPGRAGYRPVDTLYLWLLTNPAEPVLIGELNAVRSLRGVSLRYDDSWLGRGFALSEDLPLIAQEFLPREKDTAAGAVDDARPDRWGERVIRFLDKPARLSLLEYLYFAGDDRFGALGVSTARKSYQPRGSGPLPSLADVETMQRLVEMVLAGEPIPEPERRLISPGATIGRSCASSAMPTPNGAPRADGARHLDRAPRRRALQRRRDPGYRLICTDPLTVTLTCVLPASTGSASAASLAFERSIATGAYGGGSLPETLTSRTAAAL